jgi:hypothetical protein
MTFFSFLVLFPVPNQTVALRAVAQASRNQIANGSPLLPLWTSGDDPVLPEILSAGHLSNIRLRRGVVHVKQSAERLGVQKNVLRIGFDSSTENMAIFTAFHQKKQVAP